MYLLNTIDLWSNLTPNSPCWVVLWMTYAKMRERELKKSPTFITQETNGPYISFWVHFELICCVCAFLYMLLHTCAGAPGVMYICVCLPEDNLVYNVSRASYPVFFFWDRVSHWPPVQCLGWSGCPDAPGICLSQFLQYWDCKSKPWWLFYMSSGVQSQVLMLVLQTLYWVNPLFRPQNSLYEFRGPNICTYIFTIVMCFWWIVPLVNI